MNWKLFSCFFFPKHLGRIFISSMCLSFQSSVFLMFLKWTVAILVLFTVLQWHAAHMLLKFQIWVEAKVRCDTRGLRWKNTLCWTCIHILRQHGLDFASCWFVACLYSINLCLYCAICQKYPGGLTKCCKGKGGTKQNHTWRKKPVWCLKLASLLGLDSQIRETDRRQWDKTTLLNKSEQCKTVTDTCR